MGCKTQKISTRQKPKAYINYTAASEEPSTLSPKPPLRRPLLRSPSHRYDHVLSWPGTACGAASSVAKSGPSDFCAPKAKPSHSSHEICPLPSLSTIRKPV
eukprot:scaffold1282_cov251-Pinguiococcus_pyrenoidosus.AAC.49